MKVFFTLDSLANAGTERSTLDIIKNFSKDVDATVIYFYKVHPLKEVFESAGIPLVCLDFKGVFSILSALHKLKKLIRAEKPDVVVSSLYNANIFSRIACKQTGTLLAGTFVNDSYGAIRIQELKQKGIFWKFRFVWLFDKWTSGIPKYWISNAVSIAKSNSEALGVKMDKIKVIYRGRASEKFQSWNPPPLKPAFRFIAIGRLIERKGFMELLKAFAELKKRYPDICLDIYGEGGARKDFQSFIDRNQLNEAVILHGVLPNAWQQLYNAHCFVFPSWYEGFSGALIEGMMTGIPIIASDIPMNLEAVTEGKTALIQRVQDAKDLENKMEKMISNYADMIEMGKQARQEAISRFDIRIISSEYEQFLKSITGGYKSDPVY